MLTTAKQTMTYRLRTTVLLVTHHWLQPRTAGLSINDQWCQPVLHWFPSCHRFELRARTKGDPEDMYDYIPYNASGARCAENQGILKTSVSKHAAAEG